MKRYFDRHPRVGEWTVAGILLFFLLILQTVPGFLSFGTFKVSFVLPFAVAMAMVSEEMSAGIFGAVAGTLWDMVSGRLTGFGGLVLLGLCVAVSLLFSAFFRASHRLCALCSGLCFAVYGLVDYVFYYFAVSYSGGMRYLLVHVGLGSLAAAVLGFCFFGLCRRLDAWGSRPAKI